MVTSVDNPMKGPWGEAHIILKKDTMLQQILSDEGFALISISSTLVSKNVTYFYEHHTDELRANCGLAFRLVGGGMLCMVHACCQGLFRFASEVCC